MKIYNDLQNVITATSVVSSHGSIEGETNFISSDKLHLLSAKEVYGNQKHLVLFLMIPQ